MQTSILSALEEDMGYFKKNIAHVLDNAAKHIQQKDSVIIQQQELLDRVIKNAEILELSATEHLTLPEYGDFAEGMMNKAIFLVIDYSKQAISMVYRLSEVVERLDMLERLVADISTVNRKTKMLALNATIEAVHAGDAGISFQHVAAEVRDLSETIAKLSHNMQEEIAHVTAGILETHKMLVHCAAMDMQPMVESGEELERLITALLTQQEKFAIAKQDGLKLAQQQYTVQPSIPFVKNLHSMQQVIALIQQSQVELRDKFNDSQRTENLKENFLAGVQNIISSLETDMTMLPKLHQSFQHYSSNRGV